MSLPKYSSSYESTFKLLFEIISNTDFHDDLEFERGSEKEAEKFRLRFYAYVRSVEGDIRRLEERGIKLKSADDIQKARRLLTQVQDSKRYKVTLNGTKVIFTDRDKECAEEEQRLFSILQSLGKKESSSEQAYTAPKTMEEVFAQYSEGFASPEPPAPREPDPIVEATKPPPVGINANKLCENVVTRLTHGDKAEIQLPFSNEREAKEFVELQWEPFVQNNKINLKIMYGVTERVVVFTRIDTE